MIQLVYKKYIDKLSTSAASSSILLQLLPSKREEIQNFLKIMYVRRCTSTYQLNNVECHVAMFVYTANEYAKQTPSF